MPSPTSSQVHVNQLLTNLLIGYTNAMYVAPMVSPDISVMKQTDIIPKFDQSFWFRDEAGLRAPGTKSERGGFQVNTADTYYCDRYSFGFELPDEIRDNSDSIWELEASATRFVGDKISMKREVLTAAKLFTTSVWGGGDPNGAGSANFVQFSDYSNSDPLRELTKYKDSLESAMGREANKGTMGKDVWTQLQWHPDLLDTIKYTSTGMISLEYLNRLTGMEWSIGRAIKVTSARGVAEGSATYARIWGKHILLQYNPGVPAMLEPASSYTFVWNRVPNAARYVKTMRDEEGEKTIIEGNGYMAPTKVSANAGVFMQNAVA